ncbi:hypothetical protein J3R30DRAFT_3637208 [Lentinula aciculospora]|uniref:Uncharacterized protein n=1 Tax=Lentinula aciculospora TaxID=153920 RepID=A0A9W8ZQX5_9AGAR|nr:hypothetical protein J3R30DRAFT_3637208 [Lentinula aciculospora]
MFAKALVLLAALPVVLGLTLDTPTNVTSGLVSNVTWTSTDDDPTFTLELNHPSFGKSLALANNLDPTSASPLSIEWPIVPADSGYTLSAVNVSNINAVFSSSDSFSIAQAPTTGVSASVSTTFTTGSSSGVSASTTGSVTGTSSAGTTASGTSSAGASTTSASGSFNGAVSYKLGNFGVFVALLSAVVGATFFL